ncbi:MAG: hypothetical protein ACKVZ0_21970 [Gemmatimonadales bacterium]
MSPSRCRNLAAAFATLATFGLPGDAAAQARAQADVQIQTFNVTVGRSRNVTRVPPSVFVDLTVLSNNDDDAANARVQVFLPPESGILSVPPGCTPSTAGTGANGTYHAFLTCDLGSLPVNGSRTIQFAVSMPPSYIPKRYGVFAYSETPDPLTANNYAERSLP